MALMAINARMANTLFPDVKVDLEMAKNQLTTGH
jgi:hypothetical protein